jgi:hypothetical protein
MNSGDITVSILIILIFFLLYAFNILVVGIETVKKNWPVYRCNPVIMPFASMFGFDATKNFTYCIQNMQSNYMGYLLKPLNYNFNVLGDVAGNLTQNLTAVRAFFDKLRNFMKDIVQTIFGIFMNMLIEMQRLIMNIKDMLGKVVGIMATLIYMLTGAIMTMNSAWDGPPGQLTRALCFHPDTLLRLQDDSLVKMRDVPLNSVLKTGTRVCAVMHITNLDATGKPIEKLYAVPAGEQKETILVSGSHLIYDPAQGDFVHVKDSSSAVLTDQMCDTFTCLITSDHTIPIGKWIFHDWEDANGSAPKTVGA